MDIILEKFRTWTVGIDSVEARIKIFERVRDIPYYLVPQIDDPLEWAASILNLDKGSCSPKHYLLGALFKELNIPVKYATYPFKWNEQPIKYPEDLKKIVSGCPIGYHVACKANVNNKWVLIDATWDIGLKNSGLPINLSWDGASDTHNAVLPLKEVIHETIQERLSYVTEKKKQFSEGEKSAYAEFIPKFNLWLESLRLKK